MGYESDWALVLKGPRNMLCSARTWLEDQTYLGGKKDELSRARPADIYQTILDCQLKDVPAGMLVFHDDSSKCYDPWDSCIQTFLEYCREDCKLDAAYGKLGEDMGDFEFDNGEDLVVYYDRNLDLSNIAPWHDDTTQFCRLLDEIQAVGLTKGQLAKLSASMDLPVARIYDIFKRAGWAWGFRKYRVRDSTCRLTKLPKGWEKKVRA
jgi:hypothetical protein